GRNSRCLSGYGLDPGVPARFAVGDLRGPLYGSGPTDGAGCLRAAGADALEPRTSAGRTPVPERRMLRGFGRRVRRAVRPDGTPHLLENGRTGRPRRTRAALPATLLERNQLGRVPGNGRGPGGLARPRRPSRRVVERRQRSPQVPGPPRRVAILGFRRRV